MGPRLSAFLIVHDEERHLAECLASLAGLADEIVVLDDGSRDATVRIAREAGARVEYRAFDDFGHQKQAALELTSGEWVLSLDADERVTPELARRVREALDSAAARDGYWVRREVVYLGSPLRFGGMGSEWVLRLARREHARFELLPVHEHMLVDGRTGRLGGTLRHIKYDRLAEHVVQINRYTDLASLRLHEKGRIFRFVHLFRIPFELWSRLIFKLGILDGRPGVIWAAMAAFYAFLKHAKLWTGPERP